MDQNCVRAIPIGIQIPYLKIILPVVQNNLFMKKDGIDNNFFSEATSSSFFRIPIDRSFRKVYLFSYFRFEDEIGNFRKQFYEEVMWDTCIKGNKVKSLNTFSFFFDIDFI